MANRTKSEGGSAAQPIAIPFDFSGWLDACRRSAGLGQGPAKRLPRGDPDPDDDSDGDEEQPSDE